MNDNTINSQHKYVEQLLDQQRLSEALTQIEGLTQEGSDYNVTNKLESIKTSYRYLLQYMAEGAPDPQRGTIFRSLLAQAYELNDRMRIALLDAGSTRLYHQNRRTYKLAAIDSLRPENIAKRIESYTEDLAIGELVSEKKAQEIIGSYEVALKDMFMTTWCSAWWSKEEEETAYRLLRSEQTQSNALCLLVSAVTLSLMECLDVRKVEWLIEAYGKEELHVQQRALAGIAIAVHIYDKRLSLYPAMKSRLEALGEEGNLQQDLATVYMLLLLCQETEKIDRKMRDEIIPTMMERAKEIKKRMQEESDDDEKNPEWGEMFNDDRLTDKIKQMNDLQEEGADVQISSFSSLKGFSFFREMHHWFYPFDTKQNDVIKMKGSVAETFMNKAMLELGMFCDSDKYSFFFLVQQFPSNASMLSDTISRNWGPAAPDEEGVKEIIEKHSKSRKIICTNYLHDLYRFVKLYPFHREFRDIFKENIALHRTETLRSFLHNEVTLAAISAFHIKKEHWQEAAETCREIAELKGSLTTQAELYQKLGYALQKGKRFAEAVEAYRMADTIKPNTLWTDKRLAACHRQMGDYAEALKLYQKIEEFYGQEGATLTSNIASCLVELSRYDEALNRFFKLDFTEENSLRAWRGIGWCSFMTKKYDQAAKYYAKLLEADPEGMDNLNAGHVAWCMGDMKHAIACYRKVAAGTPNREMLTELFENEKGYLTEHGIAPDEIALMIEIIVS
jgi:tetratricopeptide (TPR) repeat protein